MSPARLFALAAGASALALGVVIGLVSWLGRTPTDAGGPAVADHGAEVAAAGLRAKGTEELKLIGCDQAIIMDMQRLLGDASPIRDGEPRYVITCDVANGPGPSCERAATAYFTAAGGASDGNVIVRVLTSGSATPVCSRLYAPSGAAL
jgi:hypothetical protein